MIARNISLILVWLTAVASIAATSDSQKLNVLFIAVDDLRPALKCFGDDLAVSPNIDKLASHSLQFNRAYCQYPLCNPSRVSVLTGMRPDTTKVYDLKKSLRETNPDFVTLPQLFKQNGYHTQSIGKIFHATSGLLSDPESWNEAPVAGRDRAPTPEGKPRVPHGLPFESPDVPDNMLPDGDIADKTIEALRKDADRPFFLAVGFAKPHLPFVAPQKYWDHFESTSVPLAANQQMPKGAPKFASNNSGELRQYVGVRKNGPIPDDQQLKLKEGYLACVAYMDAQVGRVMDELDRLGLRDKTVVVFWGDHGYQLGEHGTWTKHTVWDLSCRVPLMLTDPAGTGAGQQTDALVELVDIYPTLTEMCGLQAPKTLEGLSMVPLLKNPDRPWKSAAFTSWRKNIADMGMGEARTIRTKRYRFVEWATAKSDKTYYELYDHENDPDENKNIADLPENKQVVEDLKAVLHAGWKAAEPN